MSAAEDSEHQQALLQAAQALLEPLAGLMLECGIGVGEFHAVSKLAFVHTAKRQERDGQRPNVSRIASVTGLTRNEVSSLLADGPSTARTPFGANRAERVLRGWWTDRDFVDPSGIPHVLPIRGAKRSFAALVKKHSGDARVLTLLDELCRVRAVRQLPGKRVEAISRTTATVRWSPDGLRSLGDRMRSHLETLIHNLKNPSRPLYEREIINASLDPKYAAMLVRDFTQQVDVIARSMDDHLNDPHMTLRGAQAAQSGMRLGMGFYFFESNEPTPPNALDSPRESLDRPTIRPNKKTNKPSTRSRHE